MTEVERADVDIVQTTSADPNCLGKVYHQFNACGKLSSIDNDSIPLNKEDEKLCARYEQPQAKENPSLAGRKEIIIVKARITQQFLKILAKLSITS